MCGQGLTLIWAQDFKSEPKGHKLEEVWFCDYDFPARRRARPPEADDNARDVTEEIA